MKTKAEKEIQKKLKEVKSWPGKEKRLRKQKSMKRSDLCRKHDIDPSVFCNAIKLKGLPRWKTIDRINQAFAAEGIE